MCVPLAAQAIEDVDIFTLVAALQVELPSQQNIL
jgi:hypothetical protein